jgi:hypothetical protein
MVAVLWVGVAGVCHCPERGRITERQEGRKYGQEDKPTTGGTEDRRDADNLRGSSLHRTARDRWETLRGEEAEERSWNRC